MFYEFSLSQKLGTFSQAGLDVDMGEMRFSLDVFG
jgi:hypothetical protein